MNKQMAFSARRAESWRTHCQSHRDRIGALERIWPAPRHAQRLEEQLIHRLCRDDLPTDERAVALRLVVELRQCTAREVGDFFAVPAAVVVRGLSLIVTRSQVEALISLAIPVPARPRRQHSNAA